MELVQEEGIWTEISTEEGKEQKKGEEKEKEVEDSDKFSDDCLAFRLKANRADTNPHWSFVHHINWVNPIAEIIVPPPERSV